MIKFLRSLKGKKAKGVALLRLDFNTEGDWRMEAALSSIKFLLKRAEKIVIMSHKGRPAGFEKKLSLKQDSADLEKYLGRKVVFIPRLNFANIKSAIEKSPSGSILLLENLRFAKGEGKNSLAFARKLASLGDFYVNDAFAVSHRANASVAAITKFIRSYAGLEFQKELKFLSRAAKRNKKPLVVVLGGSKAHDKLGVLKFFKKKAASFLFGGVAANTMLYLRGVNVKNSHIDKNPEDLRKLKTIVNYKNIVLPIDHRIGRGAILDIGPKTQRIYSNIIKRARTIIWSGPMGLIEDKKFSFGTLAVARAIAKNKKAFSVVGGGETVMFLKKHKLDKKFSFISTGGGAMLEFLAGKKLAGIEALRKGV